MTRRIETPRRLARVDVEIDRLVHVASADGPTPTDTRRLWTNLSAVVPALPHTPVATPSVGPGTAADAVASAAQVATTPAAKVVGTASATVKTVSMAKAVGLAATLAIGTGSVVHAVDTLRHDQALTLRDRIELERPVEAHPNSRVALPQIEAPESVPPASEPTAISPPATVATRPPKRSEKLVPYDLPTDWGLEQPQGARASRPDGSLIDEPTPVVQGPTERTESSLSGEASLLWRAKEELAKDPADSIALCTEHEELYPRGQLAQEREVIRIDALVRLGRRVEAHAAGNAFLSAYPDSAYAARVRRAYGTSPDDER